MSLQELFNQYVPPLPRMPDIFELCNALKDDWNRVSASIAYREDKKRRWQALHLRALASEPTRDATEKASREDYILELRAKLKRAADDVGQLVRLTAAEATSHEKTKRRLAKKEEQLIRERVTTAASHAETCSVINQAIQAWKRRAVAAEQSSAIAQANAESLERGLPAAVDAALRPAVEAATASYGATIDEQDRENDRLRAELAECRKYVCDVICDRDAAKKERDEAVATLDFANARIRGAKLAQESTYRQLAAAQEQLASARPSGALLEENENLRRLASEACAEREELRKQLASTEDARLYAIRVANSAAEQHTAGLKALRRVDQILADYASGIFKARDVVKELCRLRGIAR